MNRIFLIIFISDNITNITNEPNIANHLTHILWPFRILSCCQELLCDGCEDPLNDKELVKNLPLGPLHMVPCLKRGKMRQLNALKGGTMIKVFFGGTTHTIRS